MEKAPQQSNMFQNSGPTKVINNFPSNTYEPEQSKDAIWKFRLEPRVAARVQSLLDSKRLNRSDFTRDCIELGEVFHAFKDVLLDNADLVVELCRRIARKV